VRGRLCILNRRLFHKATPGQPPAYAQPQPRRKPGNPDAPKNLLDIQTGIDPGRVGDVFVMASQFGIGGFSMRMDGATEFAMIEL
jgi:hypothetical protein